MTAVGTGFDPNASTPTRAGYGGGGLSFREGTAKRRTRLLLRSFAEPATDAGYATSPPPESTTSGSADVMQPTQTQTTGTAVLEIRRLSGLTWEQIGDLFDVTRRSVHHWANGKSPSARHERHIRQTLAVLRRLDAGSQAANRDRLLTVDINGRSLFDLLAERRFDDVAGLVGVPVGAERRRTALSEQTREARRPPAPALLLDALQEGIDIPASKARVARAAKATKKTG